MHPLPRNSSAEANELYKGRNDNPSLAIFRQAKNRLDLICSWHGTACLFYLLCVNDTYYKVLVAASTAMRMTSFFIA
jgi:hypothetical protein